jgi:hypothetical protein
VSIGAARIEHPSRAHGTPLRLLEEASTERDVGLLQRARQQGEPVSCPAAYPNITSSSALAATIRPDSSTRTNPLGAALNARASSSAVGATACACRLLAVSEARPVTMAAQLVAQPWSTPGEVFCAFHQAHPRVTMELELVDRSANPAERGSDLAIGGRPASCTRAFSL